MFPAKKFVEVRGDKKVTWLMSLAQVILSVQERNNHMCEML